MTLSEGFYTALGTPLTEDGHVMISSLALQVETQVAAGASGLLLLGSMGMQPAVAIGETRRAAEEAARVTRGRLPLFVGVMDNAIKGVMARVEALAGLAIDGIVLTPPYYFTLEETALHRFFTAVADRSPIPLFLYDLPVATKTKISFTLARALVEHPNVRGIKTADLTLSLKLLHAGVPPERFAILHSGLDTADVAYAHGVCRFLDGMFACAPKNAADLARKLAAGNWEGAAAPLQKLVDLRALMLRHGVLVCFSHLMNLLGMPGTYAPDYTDPVAPAIREALRQKLAEIGEI